MMKSIFTVCFVSILQTIFGVWCCLDVFQLPVYGHMFRINDLTLLLFPIYLTLRPELCWYMHSRVLCLQLTHSKYYFYPQLLHISIILHLVKVPPVGGNRSVRTWQEHANLAQKAPGTEPVSHCAAWRLPFKSL